jgi:hypothetical protein
MHAKYIRQQENWKLNVRAAVNRFSGSWLAAITITLCFLSVRANAQLSQDKERAVESEPAPSPASPPDAPGAKITPGPKDESKPNTDKPVEPDVVTSQEQQPQNGRAQDQPAAVAATKAAQSAPLPDNVPVDEEGVFIGKDHTGTPDKPGFESEPPPESQTWNENYDGRTSETERSEDVLIWIPRTLLFPAHLALDYVVRRPLIGLITVAEEYDLFHRVMDFFVFANGDAAIFPSALYDAGRGFWAAGNFFYKNAWVEGHRVDASAGYGTSGWFDLRLGDEWTVFENNNGKLAFAGAFVNDPVLTFTGIGPDTAIADRVYFTERKGEARVSLLVSNQGLSRFGIQTGFRHAELSGGGRSPSIGASSSPFNPANLPGFANSFNLMFSGLRVELDSRDSNRDFTPGSGVRLEGFGDFTFSVDASRYRFFRYGARPVAFWDISGANHVLEFSLYAEALSRVGGEPVPISELIALGGDAYLRGFVLGRFRGQSAFVHSLVYTWPVLFFLDGVIFTELGNVFTGFFDNFAYDKMVLDWGFGLRTSLSREYGFNILFGFGTNQISHWGENFALDYVRFSFGATRVF